MSLLKFGFSTSKIEVAKAQAPRTMTSEDRRKKKDEYEKKRERKYREEWGRDFTWLCYNADANIMYCRVCRDFPRLADSSSRFVMETGNSSFRLHHIQSHDQSCHHKASLAAGQARANPREAPMDAQILRMEAGQRDRLTHVFDLGYFIVRKELPFSTFPSLMSVSRKIGADVGERYASDNALRRY
jgi:hypothetical protein